MSKQLYKVGDEITLEEWGESALYLITDIAVGGPGSGMEGEAILTVRRLAPPHETFRIRGTTFLQQLLEEGAQPGSRKSPLVEQVTLPAGSFWVNQYVEVRDKSTNKKVDSGNITELSRDHVTLCGQEYPFKDYSVLALG